VGRFRRSIELAKASWATLKADRELLALPVFSFIVALVVLGLFLGLVFIVDYDSAVGLEDFELSPAGIILLALAGVSLSIVVTYFQAAMVGGARERLTGGDPTVSSALATASSRLTVIVPWAIFSWTVGAILRAIEQNAGAVGRIVVGLIGMAFRVVTFLAVPVLVVEGLGPINTLKRSAELFKQTWGENLAGQAGIGLVSFLAIIPIAIVGGLVSAVAGPVAGIIIAVPFLAALVVITTSLTAIYQTALYQYVTTNEIPTNFETADLPNSFHQKS